MYLCFLTFQHEGMHLDNATVTSDHNIKEKDLVSHINNQQSFKNSL